MVHFCLTGGHAGDAPQATRLLESIFAEYVVADKAYDSKQIVEAIEAMGGTAVIPSQSTRKNQRQIDKDAYKLRNRIERFFCRIKQFRRIATRYDKLAGRFAGFVLVAAAMIWGHQC